MRHHGQARLRGDHQCVFNGAIAQARLAARQHIEVRTLKEGVVGVQGRRQQRLDCLRIQIQRLRAAAAPQWL